MRFIGILILAPTVNYYATLGGISDARNSSSSTLAVAPSAARQIPPPAAVPNAVNANSSDWALFNELLNSSTLPDRVSKADIEQAKRDLEDLKKKPDDCWKQLNDTVDDLKEQCAALREQVRVASYMVAVLKTCRKRTEFAENREASDRCSRNIMIGAVALSVALFIYLRARRERHSYKPLIADSQQQAPKPLADPHLSTYNKRNCVLTTSAICAILLICLYVYIDIYN